MHEEVIRGRAAAADGRAVKSDWEHSPVEWFVREIASDLQLSRIATDIRSRRLICRLVQWSTGEGLPLDREVILDPDTVERFVDVGLRGSRSASTYRSILRSIGPKLTRRAPWEPKATPIPRRHIAVPYTASELALIAADAVDQPTKSRRRGARALLALGLGAGLDGRWVAKVRAEDVLVTDGVVTIAVGEPVRRSVVVRERYEEEIVCLAESAGDQFFIGGRSVSANRPGALVASLVVPTGHPKLVPSRLRSTWLIDHLACGTRLPELCAAAGIAGPAVLGELLEFVAPLRPAEAATMLRGRP